jgi:hypothetical protein
MRWAVKVNCGKSKLNCKFPVHCSNTVLKGVLIMNKKLQTILLVTLSVMLGSQSSCQLGTDATPEHLVDIGDGGFLSGVPCGQPCFFGIMPDITTSAQAMLIIQEQFEGQFYISDCDEWPGSDGGKNIICDSFWIYFDDDSIVENIWFVLTQPITVGDVIAKNGEPDFGGVVEKSSSGDSVTSVEMYLFFRSILTVIKLPEQAGTNYNVQPSTIVEEIEYIRISTWNMDIESNFDNYDSDEYEPWVGYGQYEGPIWKGP